MLIKQAYNTHNIWTNNNYTPTKSVVERNHDGFYHEIIEVKGSYNFNNVQLNYGCS